MIAGFVIEGSGTKQVLIRGIGPALTQFGVPDTLADPMLTVFRQGGPAGSKIIAQNDDWGQDSDVAAAAERVSAFALPAGSKDAALKLDLPAGIYTAHVSGVDGTIGAALVEVYDAGSATDSARLSNISLRGNVGVGDDSVIAGFVVNGDAPKRLLIRAVGPELAQFGVPGTLADPIVKIYQRAGGTDSLIAQNNDWGTDAAVVSAAAAEVGAFSLTPGSTTAAMVLWLEPGIYTAQATSNDSSSGIAIVEVYELP